MNTLRAILTNITLIIALAVYFVLFLLLMAAPTLILGLIGAIEKVASRGLNSESVAMALLTDVSRFWFGTWNKILNYIKFHLWY